MKKKYIKDLTENEGIHAPTPEIAEKLCKRFDELGINLGILHWKTYKEDIVFFPLEAEYCGTDYAKQQGYIIYTISDLLDFEDSPEDINSLPISKVVFFELKKGKYIASNGAEVTTEFVLKHEHRMFDNSGYVVIE